MRDRAGYEAVIGLEVHAQLLTETKLFSAAPARTLGEPNTAISPVCVGLPGALPVLNAKAVELAVRASLALDLQVRPVSVFERKHYFYPDLPKGYQISQLRQPLSTEGFVELHVDGEDVKIGITRLQLEEDAAKNIHSADGRTAVDYNRAGVPLVEIVSDPDMRTAAQAEAYLREVRRRLMFAGVNDGNLERGSFRCDANVSVRPRGDITLGTRVELKNINSFRFVREAIDYEIDRQVRLCRNGGAVEQETRGWNENEGKSFRMRGKEDAEDYRYFPDPDLPPVQLPQARLSRLAETMPELPRSYEKRWISVFELSREQVDTLLSHPAVARFYDAVVEERTAGFAQRAANLMRGVVLRDTVFEDADARFPVTEEQLCELVSLVEEKVISGRTAKEVYEEVRRNGASPRQLVEEKGLQQISDTSALEGLARGVIAAHPGPLSQYRAGKTAVIGFFMGQVMKQSGGTANPGAVKELLERLLKEES